MLFSFLSDFPVILFFFFSFHDEKKVNDLALDCELLAAMTDSRVLPDESPTCYFRVIVVNYLSARLTWRDSTKN